MVDFKKHLKSKNQKRPTDPLRIYEYLDRASDKGPLRAEQSAILKKWFSSRRDNRDIVLKLHTGQGKTLIGLLILHSFLNEANGRCVYLCPDKQLCSQTVEQARQFGVPVCADEPGGELPLEFTSGRSIYITTVHKLFNGLTKFGLRRKSLAVEAIVIDDAHASADRIRESLMIKCDQHSQVYQEMRDLFGDALKQQGSGTYADILSGSRDSLPVPYWNWIDQAEEVCTILARHRSSDDVRFAWPILKDTIRHCSCFISGQRIEIVPYLPPFTEFGTYANAKSRIFMSATVANDAFLIKGLGVTPEAVRNPLHDPTETWSGEKMILVPSLISEELGHNFLVEEFARPNRKHKFGRVALVPSNRKASGWQNWGASVASKDDIDQHINRLKAGEHERLIVIVNRYDGIDLPDDSCRLLLLDSLPESDLYVDIYSDSIRTDSDFTGVRFARKLEQALGRSVRGPKDYCVFILTGSDLIRYVRSMRWKRYLSSQTRKQISMGEEICKYAKAEVDEGADPTACFTDLLGQCLSRDPNWKQFYVDSMNEKEQEPEEWLIIDRIRIERDAEELFSSGRCADARKELQAILDEPGISEDEKAWYLQESARLIYPQSKDDSNTLQASAYSRNNYLLAPRIRPAVKKLGSSGRKRFERVKVVFSDAGSMEQVILTVEEYIDALRFGTSSDRFERALHEIGMLLGFQCQRPCKECKEGPDNLWLLKDGEYLLFECKSEVLANRDCVHIRETAQVNQQIEWFNHCYKSCVASPIIIIPTEEFDRGAVPNESVRVMTEPQLTKFRQAIREFFRSLSRYEIGDITESLLNEKYQEHHLDVKSLRAKFCIKPKLHTLKEHRR